MSYRIQNTETGQIHESDQAEVPFDDGETYIRFADIAAAGEDGNLIHVDYLNPIPGDEVFMEMAETGNTVRFVCVL